MVAITDTKQTTKSTARLTLQTVEIAPETIAIRCLDWDRDRFDIEFGLQNGTTYNSFIIQGEKLALVDTSHAKFRQLYLESVDRLNRSIATRLSNYQPYRTRSQWFS